MDSTREGVIVRSFALLNSFDDEHRALTLSELSRLADLPVNTTLRLANNLVRVGALERGEDARFTIGLRLFEIAALASRGIGLRPAAMPFMTDLHELTGHHVQLTVREDDVAIIIERLSPRQATGIEYRVGGRIPLAATGSGLVLLAFAPTDVQELAINTFEPRHAIDGLGSRADLRRTLAEVRKSGFMTGARGVPHSLLSAAVPIRDPHGLAVAALSIVAPEGTVEPRMLVPALATAARAISRDAFSHPN